MALKLEKTLGILGGMGPAATAEFLRLLAQDVPAQCDQEHPRVLLLSEPATPDRSRAIRGEGEDPTPLLRRGVERLIEWGAEVLAVPCNTAHFFIDRFRQNLTVPLIHIVEATVNQAKKRSDGGAWLLSTCGTRQSGLYAEYAHRVGYRFLDPTDEEQERVQQSLTYVKAGRISEAGVVLREVIEALWKRNDTLIVTACTELPLAYASSGLPPEKEISSLQALSAGCVEFLYPSTLS
ncbi:MAG: amino acid racemase [Synergistaceae bacterium]|jgi:aspartate racemase|nr:amino acid racemase [Synergistaceae bacterium]